MRRRILMSVSLLCFALIARGQGVSGLPKVPLPESGFVSPKQYVNAFFGFAISLPKDGHFQIEDLSDSDKALQHFLFAEKSSDKGITLLLISATQVLGSVADEAQKAVFIRGAQGDKIPEAIDIGRKLFWKSDVEQKTFAGKLCRLRYATATSGYVLQFSVSSYNGKLAEELRQSIESMKFFDPGKAPDIAENDSRPFLPEAARIRLANLDRADLASLDSGTISGTLYRNDSLGFSYTFPQYWKVVTEAPLLLPPNGARPASISQNSSQECTRVLLSLAGPEMGAATADARRITILVADPSCFVPDVKFPASVHDEESIELFGQALFRALAGTRLIGKDANSVRAVDLAGHIFLEVPNTTAVPVPGTSLLRKIHGSFVLTAIKHYWVIWLFESDTESDLAKMMKTSISFEWPEAVTGEAH
jgi:hypothetical protein